MAAHAKILIAIQTITVIVFNKRSCLFYRGCLFLSGKGAVVLLLPGAVGPWASRMRPKNRQGIGGCAVRRINQPERGQRAKSASGFKR